MNECKECINYDVCSTSSVNCDRANFCPMYKDRSHYVKMPPCKIGDSIFDSDGKVTVERKVTGFRIYDEEEVLIELDDDTITPASNLGTATLIK